MELTNKLIYNDVYLKNYIKLQFNIAAIKKILRCQIRRTDRREEE